MAQRPVFVPRSDGLKFVDVRLVNFVWHPGLSSKQKKKSVEELHVAACEQADACMPLEVSTKSVEPLGVKLSAFNLEFTTQKHGRRMSVECAFQGSKVFEFGGPFTDLYEADSRTAKRDPRLKASGRLIKFRFFGFDWPLEPRTAFYDWHYINSLLKNKELSLELGRFDSFTDIEFNPERSLNCQAHSVALFVSLRRRGLLYDGPVNPIEFINMTKGDKENMVCDLQ